MARTAMAATAHKKTEQTDRLDEARQRSRPACMHWRDNDLSRERSAPSLNGSSEGCTSDARPVDDRRLAGNPAIGYW